MNRQGLVARWISKSGKHWVELYRVENDLYVYNAPTAGGYIGCFETPNHAIAHMQYKVDIGLFQPDANKTPMKLEKFT